MWSLSKPEDDSEFQVDGTKENRKDDDALLPYFRGDELIQMI